jgi:23S rRNA (adenine2503-C2)-methyltransferase
MNTPNEINKQENKIDLLNLSKNGIAAFLDEIASPIGEPIASPAYRADQLFKWLYRGVDFDGMTNIPKSVRAVLAESAFVHYPEIVTRSISDDKETVKYLLRLRDGELIESVLMSYNHGYSLCLSSQAGCRMGCAFCASTMNGLSRNLQASEMLGQIITVQRDIFPEYDINNRISNIVLMGIGEPLDNYDNVVKFLRLVNLADGLNIGYRHISLSTCGIADKIYKLAELDLPITLSVSLHAVTDEERSALMPVNNKWGIRELITACGDYFRRTGRRVSFEYALISGVNDTPLHADKLARLIGTRQPHHVNLIPLNKVDGKQFERSSSGAVETFANRLKTHGINVTVRRRLGAEINASCGQLRYNKQSK